MSYDLGTSGRTYYYPGTIKALTVAVMSLFDNITVYKYDSSAHPVEAINIPLQFGPIDKTQADRVENQYYDVNNVEHGQRFYQTFPRMAITMDAMSYNSDRAAGVNEWRYWLADSINDVPSIYDNFADYQPTPYDLNFTLHIKSDKIDYLSQILENILPYFNPKSFLRIKEFSFLNIERDIPVSITGPTFDFSEDLQNEDIKLTNATIGITIEAFMYRPWTYGQIIKIINSQYFVADVGTQVTTSASTSATNGMWLDAYNSTSGVALTSGVPYPTSAIPSTSSYFANGIDSSSQTDYYWYKGQLSAYS